MDAGGRVPDGDGDQEHPTGAAASATTEAPAASPTVLPVETPTATPMATPTPSPDAPATLATSATTPGKKGPPRFGNAIKAVVAANRLKNIKAEATHMKAQHESPHLRRNIPASQRLAENLQLERFYSDKATRGRLSMFDDPRVRLQLESLWSSANSDGEGGIDKEEYIVMHRKIQLCALCPVVGIWDGMWPIRYARRHRPSITGHSNPQPCIATSTRARSRRTPPRHPGCTLDAPMCTRCSLMHPDAPWMQVA